MRLRGSARLLAVALFASLLSPVVLRPTPAVAHTSCAASSETDYYPSPSPWSDGETVRIRMVSPVSGAGCSKPAAGWPLIVYLHGYTGDRCENMSFASRATMATWGYVVLSFTARGGPGADTVASSACDPTTNATDALDDDGRDYTGPRDRLDVVQLINWARDSYTPSNCASQCVDDSKVGITGFSYGGMRSLAAGVPAATYPEFDSRVKGVAPVAGGTTGFDIKRLSNDGATPTSNLRPRATTASQLWWTNQGWLGHEQQASVTATTDAERAGYLNQTVPASAQTWFDDRTPVDDDPAVDKVHYIQIPTLLMYGWLDGVGGVYTQPAIEVFNKLPTAARYLYLGSCSHSPDPCHAANATKMRDALHRFFDRHVRGDTTCGSACEVRTPGTTTCSATGPCVLYTVPSKYTDANNNPWLPAGQDWQEKSRTSWPPSDSSTWTGYLRNDGTLSATPEGGTTCTPATGTGCKAIANDVNLPLYVDSCTSATYDTDEYQQYEVQFAADGKLIELESDLYLSTDTTRVQVYVDLYVANSAGTDLARIWQGYAQIVPVKRDATANTVYRFKAIPGGSAWTVANGQKLRVRVASKYRKGQSGEPGPSTYTLYHNDTYKSSVKLTFAP